MDSLLASATNPSQESKLFTLIVVKKDDHVLLGFKKRGFGINKWNGFGGKVESGESITTCAIRELEEECGLTARTLCKLGTLWFKMLESSEEIHEVHLFSTEEYEGCITESEEMRPQWFHVKELPFDQMWPSNQHWLPLAVKGKKFDAFFLYKNENEMIDYEIQEI